MMHDGSEDRLIKMPDAAKMLGVHPRTVRQRIAEGVLKGFCKVGRCAQVRAKENNNVAIMHTL